MNDKTIVLASNNQGKLKEFQALFSPLDIHIKPQRELGVEDADETGLSFVENAIIKARHACAATGMPAISDDSGLEVDALQGAPGIYSARFSGSSATDQSNNALLLEKLQGLNDEERSARFHCVLVYMRHEKDPTPLICHASWEGRILHAPQGEQGFGYDPLFWLEEQRCSSAELDRALKNKISHRGQALALLMQAMEARQ
ncbi:RdgB/HAM1 family non-canonical purine NTP pyrophosphatase [Pseudoteredinibacter isoporae]|uniref:dITP/XTP pyrophosphatase n=1 Tax=Pseudoteredinibacter isoporae TaxID=570281 RepID=A0A7X0JR82_9GAMM|nr:RdgB/HAM1 family non-canonical purine NTP pyrophosphatase [Pseudoteredinibacter isoporae]MBB6519906.1 XTP/dITP diphosphohydrolase [Pseudoteredinibacter isoporae]NHO85484.1 RdgB/HAM1 family non-canonical purine NTP pyrophosphatase [Pseudoteredinibacter isoporae]NIB26064.1 RdgB/HAM1 family non-canonical purine NTP pyrophosphatase [Pseudoteredinibacter isoporae]